MSLRIRKLVPCETIKLMGFERKDYQAMRDAEMSDMQIYHCAGDSLVTTVCAMILGQFFSIKEQDLIKKIENYVESLVKD